MWSPEGKEGGRNRTDRPKGSFPSSSSCLLGFEGLEAVPTVSLQGGGLGGGLPVGSKVSEGPLWGEIVTGGRVIVTNYFMIFCVEYNDHHRMIPAYLRIRLSDGEEGNHDLLVNSGVIGVSACD